MNRITIVVLLLCIGLALVACGGQEETPAPVVEAPIVADMSVPTDTPTEAPTATATPQPALKPLSVAEEEYFREIYDIRDKAQAGFYTFDRLGLALADLNPPASLAPTHQELTDLLTDLTFKLSLFRLASMTFVLTNCSINSYDYWLCTQRQNKAKQDMYTYAAASDDAKAAFLARWEQAQQEWDRYRIAHGAQPIPTATPFPLPPITTPVPIDTAGRGVFGTEVTVDSANFDAWPVIKDENMFNDAPDAGDKYVMVHIRVTNHGQETIDVGASDFSIYLDDQLYQAGSGQVLSDKFEGGELAPGESSVGYVYFEVPKVTEGELLLTFLKGDIVFALEPTELTATEAAQTPPSSPDHVPASTPDVVTTPTVELATLPTSTPVPTRTPTPKPTVMPQLDAVVSTPSLNVRGGPGTVYPVVGQVTQGDSLPVLARNADGSWLEVTLEDESTGWVFAELVSLSESIDSLPIAATPQDGEFGVLEGPIGGLLNLRMNTSGQAKGEGQRDFPTGTSKVWCAFEVDLETFRTGDAYSVEIVGPSGTSLVVVPLIGPKVIYKGTSLGFDSQGSMRYFAIPIEAQGGTFPNGDYRSVFLLNGQVMGALDWSVGL